MSQEAQMKVKKTIYIVWIIPIVAMVLAGWMIYKHYDAKGSDIIITFNSGSGMAVGKTPLMYNGIKIGHVSDMTINPADITKVDVTVTVDKIAAFGALRKGNIFWKVEPKLSLTEVSGLSTILSGVYIGVLVGTDSKEKLHTLPFANRFIASESVPVNLFDKGVVFTLHADEYDINVGAPLLYKKINIGKVIDAKLTERGIDYLMHVEKEYAHLVKEKSQFWEISGVEVKASLAGLRVKMDSLASVVAGGISLNSPVHSKPILTRTREYKLFENKEALNLQKEIITLVSKNGYNIDYEAAHVFFKGSKAGNIISLDYNPTKDETTFKIKLKSEFSHLANKDAHFWIVEPHIGFSSVKGLDAIANGPYISFETSSHSKEMKNTFILHTNAPKIKGKHFKLIADEGFNLKHGVNVIYKDIVIGNVQSLSLHKNSKKVVFDILIASEYTYLVNDSSSFYIQGALEMDASFEGVYLNIGSLASMVHSGIVLHTQDLKAKRKQKDFLMYESFKDFEDKTYIKDGGKVYSLISNTLGSLEKNSPVLYKGIHVGKVLSYTLNKKSDMVDIKIYIEKEYCDKVNVSTNFFNVSGINVQADFEGFELQTSSVETIIRGGLAFKTLLKDKKTATNHVFKLYENEKEVDNKYVNIVFLMKDESNLKEGSDIRYKSITVGQVKHLKLVDDEIVVYALIKEEHKNLLAQDSIFWVDDIHVGLDHVKNPSAILTGAFIKVQKGHSTQMSNQFALSTTEPVKTLNKEGLRVVVTGKKLSSLGIGSPVFYRQIKIGSVEGFGLSDDSKGVKLRLYIQKCYAYLVHTDSSFYNAGAIGVDVSLLGVKISTETVSTMINGGVSMVTPETQSLQAENMSAFTLHNDPEEEWLEYAPELINIDDSCKKLFK